MRLMTRSLGLVCEIKVKAPTIKAYGTLCVTCTVVVITPPSGMACCWKLPAPADDPRQLGGMSNPKSAGPDTLLANEGHGSSKGSGGVTARAGCAAALWAISTTSTAMPDIHRVDRVRVGISSPPGDAWQLGCFPHRLTSGRNMSLIPSAPDF